MSAPHYRRYVFADLLLLCTVLFTAPAAAQEWTRFRGPNGSGQSDARTIPAEWSASDINWKVSLPGAGHSSPVLWGDKIFLTSGDRKTGERMVLCLAAADGKLLWKKSYPASVNHVHDQNSFASSTPALDRDRVYAAWATPEHYTVVALTHDGEEVWQQDLGPFASQHGFGTSPIVYNDLVIIGNEQDSEERAGGAASPTPAADGRSFLVALDSRTGKIRWKTPRKSSIVTYATPCIFEHTGGRAELIFDGRSHGMSGIDPATGHVNWELPVFDGERRAVGSPFVLGDMVIGACGVGGGNNTLYAVRPGDGANKPEQVYKIDKTSAPYVPTPVASGNLVFIWGDRGIVTCFDGLTGTTKWRERVGGNFSGSPVRAGERIFCVSTDGEVVVLAAADKFQVLARNPLNETCRSTPAIAGGRMYVRTESHLYSVGGK